jgi:hypothetical protein
MFKKNIVMAILGMFTPSFATPSVEIDTLNEGRAPNEKNGKGQKRNTASKPSGAAQLKRNAKKRNNINKRKGK